VRRGRGLLDARVAAPREIDTHISWELCEA
jgi:hypothetical protein